MNDKVLSTTIDRSRHLVLVVDDNPVTRYATARVIRAAGFLTQEAETGAQAIAMATLQVSAVVLDVHLPDLSGFEVCRVLRAGPLSATLPVIHLSGTYVHDADLVAGLDAGADAYLVHPVEPTVLIATLQALIRARLAEERLRSSEARFRAIYDRAPIGMALIDGAGLFADANPVLLELLDRSSASLAGTAVSALAPLEWQEFVRQRTTGEGGDAAVWQGEFPLLRPDGRPVWLAWTMSGDIEPGLRIGTAVDVSARYELARRQADVLEREQAARLAAERHSRTKDDFVAVLSHELRNPLNAIAGWVHLLRTRPQTADLLQKGLVAIDRGVKMQASLISDILDVSRITSGKLRLLREWIEPGALVTASIEALAASATAKHVEVRFENHGEAQPAWLDPTRFQQIVWNLVSNAIKFSAHGGVVRVGLKRGGDRLALSVQDAGCGIDKDFLSQLFDRFAQCDSPDNRMHGGLGLGLSIVKTLAELHGGGATASSAGLGHGSTLAVELQVAPEANGGSERTDSVLPDAGRSLEGMEVLVVEDNVDASEIVTLVLSDAGARVRLAPDVVTALQLCEQRWPDILVSDIGLPGRDGYDLVRQLRQMEGSQALHRVFAVALTAFSRPQDQAKASEAGFDAHLAKPLQPHALLALVASRAADLVAAAAL